MLESVGADRRWGRYSFLGYRPRCCIVSRGGEAYLRRNGSEEATGQPSLDFLRDFLARHRGPQLADLPPFTGGLVGFIGWGAIGLAHPVASLPTRAIATATSTSCTSIRWSPLTARRRA